MATATPPPAAPRGRVRSAVHHTWRFTKRLLLWTAAAAIGATALYLWAAYSFTYSTGERAGYVQKFSKKGWLCKTWEGELAMANQPGAVPEIFAFTLREDSVAAEVNKSMGTRVALTYQQHLGLPSCFGDTSYWVTSVRPVAGAH